MTAQRDHVIVTPDNRLHVVIGVSKVGVHAIPLGGSTNADSHEFRDYKILRKIKPYESEQMMAARRAEIQRGNLDSSGRPRKT